MNDRRELLFGFLAALVSIFIVGGSFIISFSEEKPKLAELSTNTPDVTNTPVPTAIILTPRPGEPTLTPSLTQPEATPTVPSPTPSCQFPPNWVAITISPGDTLENLAETYQTTTDALIDGNCLLITKLSAGSQLYVPQLRASLTPTKTKTPRPTATICPGPPIGWVIYIVQAGDTLYHLSQIYGITVAELTAANCLNTTLIKTGSKLWVPYIPTKTPLPSPTFTPSFTASPTAIVPPPTANLPTNTPTPTATFTFTPLPTATATPTPTDTPTSTPTGTPTNTPTGTDTATPTATDTSSP